MRSRAAWMSSCSLMGARLAPGVHFRSRHGGSRRYEVATVEHDLIAALEGFSGQLIGPEDVAYEEARRVHNGLVDKRPALIARCLGAADVVAAVNLARDQGLEVSVRGGGHNVAGKAVTDGGLMVDLSLMKGMRVDPASRTTRAQGGVTW